MKKFIKIITMITALAVLAASFIGCGNKAQERRTFDGKNLTLWVSMATDTRNAGLSNNNEMFLFQEMEKRTGIHIDFIHPSLTMTGKEAVTTLFLDEELPDIIQYAWDAYPGGPTQAIEDGVIIALNEHIDLKTVCPGYWSYVGNDNPENDARRKAVTTTEGNYYGFNDLNIGTTKGFSGLFTRRDKLAEWGMEVPKTIDDWEALFAKAKAEGFKKPLSCALSFLSCKSTTGNTGSGFYPAFDIAAYMYIDDLNGKPEVVYAPNQPGYTEYVSTLRDWFAKGYIDPDFATAATDVINSNMVNNESIASMGYVGSTFGTILPAAKAKNENFDLVACPFPTNIKTGEPAEFQAYNNPASSVAYAITWQCGDYEAAAKWCDYVYTEEGIVLRNFGMEGVHHTVEMRDDDGDGKEEKHYVYTDLITNPENSDCNTVGEALYKYVLPANAPGYNQHIDYLMGYYQYDSQKEAIKTWNIPSNKENGEGIDTPGEHTLPTLDFTQDESTEMAELRAVCESPLEATFVEVIMGKKNMDDWKAAVKTANDNGYTRIIEIYNDAYLRYLNKK